MTSRRCSGVVLAGGANTRFQGAPKGLLEIGPRRVVDLVLDALRPNVDELLLITNDPAVSSAMPDVRSRPDVRRGRGSLLGLHSALTYCEDAALVVGWDMPFLSSALLAMLRHLGEEKDVAAIPEGARGPEPLCAYYPRHCLDVVEEQIESGAMRLSKLIEVLPRRVIISRAEVERFGSVERLFANINSPTDFAAARLLTGLHVEVEIAEN